MYQFPSVAVVPPTGVEQSTFEVESETLEETTAWVQWFVDNFDELVRFWQAHTGFVPCGLKVTIVHYSSKAHAPFTCLFIY